MKYLKNSLRSAFSGHEDIDGRAEKGTKHTLLGFPVEVLADGWRFDADSRVGQVVGGAVLRSLLKALRLAEMVTGRSLPVRFQDRAVQFGRYPAGSGPIQ